MEHPSAHMQMAQQTALLHTLSQTHGKTCPVHLLQCEALHWQQQSSAVWVVHARGYYDAPHSNECACFWTLPIKLAASGFQRHVHPFQVTAAGRCRRKRATPLKESRHKCLLITLRAVWPLCCCREVILSSVLAVWQHCHKHQTSSRSTVLLRHCRCLGDKGHRHHKKIG